MIFIIRSFVRSFTDLQINDPAWYQVLTANLSKEQQNALQEILVLADQRKAAAESKKIEQSGGRVMTSLMKPPFSPCDFQTKPGMAL